MRRLLLNILATLSLRVCLAGVVAWGRGCEVGDQIHVAAGVWTASVISEGGSYGVFTHHSPMDYGVRWSWEAYTKRCGTARAVRALWRFECDTGGGPWRTA